jgi:single-stranded-DNA-specific exonuclease
LQAALSLPRPLCALLVSRGLGDPDEAKGFLRPLLSGILPADTLPEFRGAVSRILQGIRDGERILVHGDYDVDGMAGTALLTRWLRFLGAEVVPFVPHRSRDGYDLGPAGLELALRENCSLLITVDCGILAHEAVSEAQSQGIDVIVTDHHAPGDELPPGHSVLNPGREDSSYGNPDLCGTGVAYKLCQGLAEAVGIAEEELHPFLDLVGLATVADLVPLRGENRVLARYGLRALARTTNLGIQALMDEAGVSPDELSAGKIGFGLAPRLNALGRLGEPQDGLNLLLTEAPEEAKALARRAEEVNRERQAADRSALEEVLERLDKEFDPSVDFGLVLESENWHPGVVGIVASRVVERTHRPTVLIALEGDRGRGSARSIPGFHILDGIRGSAALLERFGGHRQAAGLEIHRDRIPEFRANFNDEARRILRGRELRPTLRVDVEVLLEEMSDELLHFLDYVGPYGIGNPAPSFLARGVRVLGVPRIVGSDHLKLNLRQGNADLEAIGFNLASRIPVHGLGREPLDVVFQLHENEFRGVRRLQARLKDLRPADESGHFGPSGR